MELLLSKHHQLIRDHIEKINSVLEKLESSAKEYVGNALLKTEEITAEWMLEQSHQARFLNVFTAVELLSQGRLRCKLTKAQEFDCTAALLQLKLDIAPLDDIQPLLLEVNSLSQQLNTPDARYKYLLLEGDVHAASGNADLAYNLYGEAARMFANQSEDSKYLDPFIRQQSCLHIQGENKKALGNLLPLIESDNTLPPHLDALLRRTLGDIYRSNANWHKAELFLQQAIAIAASSGDSIHEGEWKGDLGQVYRSSGLHQQALTLQMEAYQSALNRGDRARLAVACGYLGFTKYALAQRDHEGALFYLGCRLVMSEYLADKYGIGWCLNNIGKVYLSLQEIGSAIRFFERRLQLAKDTGNLLGEGTALGNLGSAYRDLGNYAEAIKYHQLYLKNASTRLDIGGEAIMLRELVIDCILSRQFDSALQYAVQGMVTNNTIRDRFSEQDDQFKIANHEKNQAHLYTLLQFILTKLQMYASALLISEMGRARALCDLMVNKSGSKSDFLIDLDKVTDSSQQLDEAAVHQCFAHVTKLAHRLKSTLVIYSVLEEPSTMSSAAQTYIYMWVVPPNGDKGALHFKKSLLKTKSIDLALDEDYVSGLRRDMESAARDIRQRKNRSKVMPTADKLELLHGVLIGPIEDYLPSDGSNLIMIPHGFLFNLPFSALRYRDKFLVERFSISQAPSLAILHQLAHSPEEVDFHVTKHNLIIGNPAMPREDIPQLPGAEKEARHLHTVLGGHLMIGSQATKDAVLAHLPQCSLAHLATHAMLTDSIDDQLDLEEQHADGDYSIKGAIVCTKSNDSCSGILTSRELQNLDLSACELLTLSCCRTACGKVTGDGVLGLSRAILVAGARCLVLTHWKVHDRSAPILMETFYSHYKHSHNASAALRAGMLRLISDNEPIPHWAAFCVMGLSPGMVKP